MNPASLAAGVPAQVAMQTRTSIVILSLLLSVAAASADPLTGRWVLNVARSHYGHGAEPRKQETFQCEAAKQGVRCTIDSLRADGRRLVGRFSAGYDGEPRPAMGIPGVDQVILRSVDDFIADATFNYRGKPVFGYRAIKASSGRSLTIVSVEPTTRAVLTSVVVYDRR
jgi:hypothetical protein